MALLPLLAPLILLSTSMGPFAWVLLRLLRLLLLLALLFPLALALAARRLLEEFILLRMLLLLTCQ